jgi:hypothetical protein
VSSICALDNGFAVGFLGFGQILIYDVRKQDEMLKRKQNFELPNANMYSVVSMDANYENFIVLSILHTIRPVSSLIEQYYKQKEASMVEKTH